MAGVALITPADVLGRRVSQLGTAISVNLTVTSLFIPIFTCGDRQVPATDQKKCVIPFIAAQNFSGAISGTFSFGSSPTGTDWGTGLSAPSQPVCFVMSQPLVNQGAGGYSPGTVFGLVVTGAGSGTADFIAYGWSE